MITNEQAVITETAKIEQLKQNYMSCVSDFRSKTNESRDARLNAFIRCQQSGSSLFNHIENFVGNSGVLGAHSNGLWITGFAETCYAYLDSAVIHFTFLRSHAADFPEVAPNIEPSSVAYANMQRLVMEYMPRNKADSLRKKFLENNLPTAGFDTPAAESAIPKWQLISGFCFGALILFVSIALSIYLPTPTVWQMFVLRGALAIGIAASASIVPGFLNLAVKYGYFKVIAGGSLAIFVIIWFVNPPALPAALAN